MKYPAATFDADMVSAAFELGSGVLPVWSEIVCLSSGFVWRQSRDGFREE